MEFATEKQSMLHQARQVFEQTKSKLDRKLAEATASDADFLAVMNASQELRKAEEMQVCFDCGKGCEKPKEWTQLYRDLETENSHLKVENAEYKRLIESERLTSSAEIRNLQQDLNQAIERANDTASDLEVNESELTQARTRIEELESKLLDAMERIAQLSPLQDLDSQAIQ